MFDGCLRDQQKTEYVDVKLSVELFFGNRLDRGELIDAGVIHEYVEVAIILDRGIDDAYHLGVDAVDQILEYGGFGPQEIALGRVEAP